ncbi:MAG: short-chain dehydrogenase [Proteobacteria bacterium]|nr:short-chain dehydrogenase [Pseudomonadota bacterium]
MNNQKQKIAIFGANGTIGQALCAHYQKQSDVYAFTRNDFDIDESGLVKILLDDFNEDSVFQAANKFDSDFFDKIIVSIGILHNEDFMPEKRIEEISSDQFLETLRINTLIPTLIAKSFYKKLKKNDKATLAFLSARVGSITDNRSGGWYSYRASKAALNMVIKNLSIELRRYNKESVVIGLHPGTVDSRLSQPFQKNLEDSKIFSADFSVLKLSSVIDSLDIDDSGKCIAWDGEDILP